ncbi:MAG: TetR/AcrR family transcriptional regulator [Candidatus Geothermincolia bacterium]
MPIERAGMKEEAPKRVREPEKKRGNILDASLKLFAEKGLHGTSIRDIAAEAGENAGLIYYYFHDKDDLYYAVGIERVLPALGDVLALETDTRGTPAERLKRLIAAYIAFAANSRLQMILFARAMLRLVEKEETPFMAVLLDRIAVIEAIVKEGQSNGEFVKVDGNLVGYLIMVATLVYLFGNLAAENNPDLKLPAYSDKEIDKFMNQAIFSGILKMQ